jgi:hypothetical protein
MKKLLLVLVIVVLPAAAGCSKEQPVAFFEVTEKHHDDGEGPIEFTEASTKFIYSPREVYERSLQQPVALLPRTERALEHAKKFKDGAPQGNIRVRNLPD